MILIVETETDLRFALQIGAVFADGRIPIDEVDLAELEAGS